MLTKKDRELLGSPAGQQMQREAMAGKPLSEASKEVLKQLKVQNKPKS